jgi:hypothetical protein
VQSQDNALSSTRLTVLQQQDTDTSVLPLNQSLLHAFTAQAAIVTHYSASSNNTASVSVLTSNSNSVVQAVDSTAQQQDEDEL